MRRTVISAFLLLLAVSAFAQDTQRYFVGTRAGHGRSEAGVRQLYRDVESQAQLHPRGVVTFKYVDAFAADLTAAEVSALKRSAGVTYVEPVVEMRAFAYTPVRNYSGQTVPPGIDAVKSRDAWIGGRGTGTNVVVIDTGLDTKHPDLKSIYQGGLNTYTADALPTDDNGHGTHVAGTIAAADDNTGVVGVAPGVNLWAIKVLNSAGSGSNDKLITGLEWVIAKKAELGGNWVINLSLGHAGISVTERLTIEKTIAAGIVVVAASGNDSSTADGVKPVSYPAGYANVITVGAVNSQLAVASFSNQGPEMDLVAPGVGILSTVATGFGSKSLIDQAGELYASAPLTGSPRGTVSGEYVYCGLGANAGDYPASVRGRIALVQRGAGVTFAWKSRRAKEAGATAVIIYNSEIPPNAGMNWTMRPGDVASDDDVWMAGFEYLLTTNLTHEDGEALRKKAAGGVSVTAVNEADDYDVYGGTSMASPHVAGAAALIWSLAPTASPDQIRNALTITAKDLGTAGQDSVFGFGMLNVFEAAKLLAPNAFGSAAQPTNSKPTTGRGIGRRS